MKCPALTLRGAVGSLAPRFAVAAWLLAAALWVGLSCDREARAEEPASQTVTLNEKADGFRGIWYMNQPSGDEYKYKYSGGLGTYCAKHAPFAVYRKEVDKTFFCYGGAAPDDNRRLHHMVSYYDHETGEVARPTLLLDKKTSDAHDNPVIAVDKDGYVWIFSTSHGRARPSYIHKSAKPYDIEKFEQVSAVYQEDGQTLPLDNFSYLQAWYDAELGFVCPFTRYGYPRGRNTCLMTSRDGVHWSKFYRLGAINEGHYQISNLGHGKVATMMNHHPEGKGLNWRTNLYYIESHDRGNSWQAVDGQTVDVPLTSPDTPALVHDYAAEGLNVYLKDLDFDRQGRPVLLYITSKGYESGPQNDPRTWMTAHWVGDKWQLRPVTTSDNNYDMGSLYVEEDGTWRLIAPALSGPQPYNPGGEVGMWTSSDQGKRWELQRQLTAGSDRNHTYVRQPVNAHPDFYAFWADGNARAPSESSLYFSTRQGDVYRLPAKMSGRMAKPEPVPVDQGTVGGDG